MIKNKTSDVSSEGRSDREDGFSEPDRPLEGLAKHHGRKRGSRGKKERKPKQSSKKMQEEIQNLRAQVDAANDNERDKNKEEKEEEKQRLLEQHQQELDDEVEMMRIALGNGKEVVFHEGIKPAKFYGLAIGATSGFLSSWVACRFFNVVKRTSAAICEYSISHTVDRMMSAAIVTTGAGLALGVVAAFSSAGVYMNTVHTNKRSKTTSSHWSVLPLATASGICFTTSLVSYIGLSSARRLIQPLINMRSAITDCCIAVARTAQKCESISALSAAIFFPVMLAGSAFALHEAYNRIFCLPMYWHRYTIEWNDNLEVPMHDMRPDVFKTLPMKHETPRLTTVYYSSNKPSGWYDRKSFNPTRTYKWANNPLWQSPAHDRRNHEMIISLEILSQIYTLRRSSIAQDPARVFDNLSKAAQTYYSTNLDRFQCCDEDIVENTVLYAYGLAMAKKETLHGIPFHHAPDRL